MFENLTTRLTKVVNDLRGRGRLTDDNIKDSLRQVRMALLEADVALPVVKDFLARVRERAVGQEVNQQLSPGQALIKIVQDELTQLMGEASQGLDLAATPPVVILMAGLQGAGKTTSVAKLARWLKETQKKSVLVVSADIYRPAAIAQLEVLAGQVGVDFFPSDTSQRPADIAQAALQHAKQKWHDVVIVDTAGRLHIDDKMMDEIKQLHATVHPTETLFVVDSMTGQDAANTAHAFNDALPLTGVVLTKTDGDARGGAALSIREITGKPIKFLGVGEKTEALEPFYPDRMASRILGMGDVLSLIDEAERKVDKKAAQALTQKITKGKGFDLEDFRDQLQQMNKMGGMGALLDKLPGAAQLPAAAKAQLDDKRSSKMTAIINSMTPHERRHPLVIKASRKRRISAGSGTQVQEVNQLLKQFMQMQKMMKKVTRKGGMQQMMRQMQNSTRMRG